MACECEELRAKLAQAEKERDEAEAKLLVLLKAIPVAR